MTETKNDADSSKSSNGGATVANGDSKDDVKPAGNDVTAAKRNTQDSDDEESPLSKSLF